jgi:hypothetical protein
MALLAVALLVPASARAGSLITPHTATKTVVPVPTAAPAAPAPPAPATPSTPAGQPATAGQSASTPSAESQAPSAAPASETAGEPGGSGTAPTGRVPDVQPPFENPFSLRPTLADHPELATDTSLDPGIFEPTWFDFDIGEIDWGNLDWVDPYAKLPGEVGDYPRTLNPIVLHPGSVGPATSVSAGTTACRGEKTPGDDVPICDD